MLREKFIIKNLIAICVIISFLMSCKKSGPSLPNVSALPEVSTISYTLDNKTNQYTFTGKVLNEGSSATIERGFCWSTNINPSVSDNKQNNAFGIGEYSITINPIEPGIIYHVRAYATNVIGTSYGKDVSFSSTSESEQMVAYANKNSISYLTDPSGLLYQIIVPGTGIKPNLNNIIIASFIGKLMNDTQFDSGTISFRLEQVIKGWQIALSKIGVGGKIKILVPSLLAYGSSGSGSIPGFSPTYFEITLSSVK